MALSLPSQNLRTATKLVETRISLTGAFAFERTFRARIAAPAGSCDAAWPWGRTPPGGGGVTVPGVELFGVGFSSTMGLSGSFIDGGVAGSWKAVVTPFGICATGRPGAPDVRNDWSAGFLRAMEELLNCKLESGGRSMLAWVLEFRSKVGRF